MIGKWVGGFFGLIWGASIGFGFLGMLGGIWLGHRFDQAFGRRFVSSFHHQRHSATQETFFLSVFEVMGHVAKADGRVSEDEIHVAKMAMHQFGLSHVMKQKAILAFNRGKAKDFDLVQALGQLRSSCWGNPILLQLFVDFQSQMARADGPPGAKKQAVLKHIHQFFGMHMGHGSNQQGYGHVPHRRQGQSLHEAYEALGIKPSATDAELKKAYRLKMKAHHPDRLIAKGLPEEMIKLATEKTKVIQKAYQAIKQERGL